MDNATINAHLASRTASLLADWAGLAPGRKIDASGNGVAAALMLMSGAVRSETPSPDATQKMAASVFAKLAARDDGAYVSFSTDYGPDHSLANLADECGIRASWPNKSRMSISKVYTSDGSGDNCVAVATGYRAPTTYHYLTDNGWLVAHVPVARQLHDLVIKGIAAGDVPTSVATFEPHSVPAVTTGRKRKAG